MRRKVGPPRRRRVARATLQLGGAETEGARARAPERRGEPPERLRLLGDPLAEARGRRRRAPGNGRRPAEQQSPPSTPPSGLGDLARSGIAAPVVVSAKTAASRGPEPKPRQAEAGTASSRAAGRPTRRRGPTIFSLPRALEGAEFPSRSGRPAGEEGDRCATRPGDGPRHPAVVAEAAFGDGCGGPLRSSRASNDDAPRCCRGTEAAPLAQAIGRPTAKPTPRRVHARTSRRSTSQLSRRCSGLDFGPKEPDETGGSVETPSRDIATKLMGSWGPGAAPAGA